MFCFRILHWFSPPPYTTSTVDILGSVSTFWVYFSVSILVFPLFTQFGGLYQWWNVTRGDGKIERVHIGNRRIVCGSCLRRGHYHYRQWHLFDFYSWQRNVVLYAYHNSASYVRFGNRKTTQPTALPSMIMGTMMVVLVTTGRILWSGRRCTRQVRIFNLIHTTGTVEGSLIDLSHKFSNLSNCVSSTQYSSCCLFFVDPECGTMNPSGRNMVWHSFVLMLLSVPIDSEFGVD